MSTIEERLQGQSSLPWIPDPAKAAKYERDSYTVNPVIGIAIDHFTRQNFRGDGEYDVVVLHVDDVGDVAIHCQATVLANQMRAARPKPGEKVGVAWKGEKIGASGVGYSDYKVVVEREIGGEFRWADGPPEQDPVPAPVVAAPAAPAPPAAPTPAVDEYDDVPF